MAAIQVEDLDVMEGGPLQEGTVTQVNKGGLIYIQDVKSQKIYVLPLDKLAGYRGESLHEAGLRVGTRLYFRTDGDLIDYAEMVHGNDDSVYGSVVLRGADKERGEARPRVVLGNHGHQFVCSLPTRTVGLMLGRTHGLNLSGAVAR